MRWAFGGAGAGASLAGAGAGAGVLGWGWEGLGWVGSMVYLVVMRVCGG